MAAQYDEEQRRRRRARQKAQRQRTLIMRLIVFFCLVALLIAVLVVATRLTRGRNSSTSQTSISGDVMNGSTDGGTSGAVEAADSTSNVTALPTDADSSVEVPGSKSEALRTAKAYAAQYDYDKAIALLSQFDPDSKDSEIQSAVKEYTKTKESCVAVDVTSVPHIFFHSLLNDDRGLREDVVGRDRAYRNDTAMTTADEFDHIIQDMYDAGYVMVSLDDLCIKTKDSSGVVHIAMNTKLMLPEGKKAFVLSEDDLNYYHTYGIGTQGYATKMVLDDNGDVKCEYTDENGDTKIGNYDVVPRMDAFVAEHPDFSYHGHKGTVALTGYNGVLGYRTSDYYKDIHNENLDQDQIDWLKDHPDFDWDQDVADATAIATRMKETGWTFASHTYAHWNATNKSAEQLKSDNERWMKVNHSIVGDIDKIIFAFGGDIGGVGQYTSANDKYVYFKSQGYNIFCNVDGNIGWTEFGDGYMRTGRVAMDGFTMYQAMTASGVSHSTYAKDYEILGVTDIADFFNPNRITPIEGE